MYKGYRSAGPVVRVYRGRARAELVWPRVQPGVSPGPPPDLLLPRQRCASVTTRDLWPVRVYPECMGAWSTRGARIAPGGMSAYTGAIQGPG